MLPANKNGPPAARVPSGGAIAEPQQRELRSRLCACGRVEVSVRDSWSPHTTTDGIAHGATLAAAAVAHAVPSGGAIVGITPAALVLIAQAPLGGIDGVPMCNWLRHSGTRSKANAA